jgi:chlorobactene glucosyltransferase
MTIIFPVVALFVLGITLANVIFWPRVRSRGSAGGGQVSVLIPARNEELNLPACLDSVLSQGAVVGEILIYDDHSTDRTGEVIAAYRQRDARVRAVACHPLAPGWTGKNMACWQLAKAATGEILLFLDADARLLPGAIASLRGEMDHRRLELLSCWPGLEMETRWERLLMPMLNYVVFSIYPAPLALFFSYPSLALAHGACLMFQRQSYFELGGHATVRDQIFEDTRLAQLWREAGRRGLCLDGQRVVRVRMYENLAGIWQGFQKNFYPAFQREASFWSFIAFHLVFLLLPFLILPGQLLGGVLDSRILVAVAGILTVRLMLAIRFRHPVWSSLAHPLSQIMLLGLGLSSWWRCRTGRGVTWKGRDYHTKIKSDG